MKRVILGILMLLMLTGCQENHLSQSREEAYDRWHMARATVLYGAANEHLRVGQLDKAARKAGEALALAPEYTDARVLLGKVLIEQGQYSRAVTQLEMVRENAPESARVAYLLGVANERHGELSEALDLYRQAYELEDDKITAVVAAGEVLVQMGRFEEARSLVRSHIRNAQDNPAMYELAGRLARMDSDYAEAAGHFRTAHNLDYGNHNYREALAKAQFLDGNYAEAADTLEDLLSLGDYEPPAWVHTMLGNCHMALGRHIGAREAFDSARRLRPSDAMSWTNLARAALALDDLPRAILWADKARKIDAHNTEALLLLGYALLADGQADRAVKVLGDNAGRHPDSAMVYWLLGRAYAEAGEEDHALHYYNEAMNLDPHHPLAQRFAEGELALAPNAE